MNQGEPLRYRTKSGEAHSSESSCCVSTASNLSSACPLLPSGARNYRRWRWPQLRQDISIWIHLADLDESRLRGSAG